MFLFTNTLKSCQEFWKQFWWNSREIIKRILIFFFPESNIELEEKSVEETEYQEDENEANHLSKLLTKKNERNINLTVEQIVSDENQIPVGCDESTV